MAAATAAPMPRAFRVDTGFSLPGELALVLLTVLVLIFLVYPTAWIIVASFKTPATMFSATRFEFTLENYVSLFQTGFARNIFNSLYLCIAAVLISTFVSTIAAYTFSRMRFRGKSFIFGSVLLGQCFPWIILVTPLFILFAKMGMLNNHLSMLFVYTAITIPFSVYLLVGYLEGVPRSLDEAAIIDGCSRFQAIWLIIFPIMLPGIVATATYAFMLCWTEYLFALAFLTKTQLKTMPLALYAFFGEDTSEWGRIMAASALTTAPTLLLFLPLQTRLTSGLAAGSVKQ
ncbi:MAG: carbohydrate ABC transporter permease [Geminicoccaceae bacterium]|jgi:ABC-type glycerol-3-phosphate transport system permease component|nr:carbohydrate ABC transporter permease [Geminicoccaceae bacterium]MCB9969661.1 carbohydrate ABC transporter permease [Geminicoccaceae bacterium]